MKEKVIFFGNGLLSDVAFKIMDEAFDVIFRARTREDLARVVELKKEHPDAHGILASFGVMVPSSVLEIFEPEGILNIHPSLLPKYRGASPIESAILAGDNDFSVSVMKLVKAMDAGPIYYQETISGLPMSKEVIYKKLATCGAEWIRDNISNLPTPKSQNDAEATFCGKLNKKMSYLTPETDDAKQTFRKIVAYQGFPKPKYAFFDKNCIILEASILEQGETAPLIITCADGHKIAVWRLQPEGRKEMDAKSFINGYSK